jgi:hypothetical protein
MLKSFPKCLIQHEINCIFIKKSNNVSNVRGFLRNVLEGCKSNFQKKKNI